MEQSTNQFEMHSGTAHLALEPVLNAAGVKTLYGKLDAVLAAGVPVVVTCDNVERVDTATCQTLAAFSRRAQELRLSIEWRNPSPAIRQAMALLGLETQFGVSFHD